VRAYGKMVFGRWECDDSGNELGIRTLVIPKFRVSPKNGKVAGSASWFLYGDPSALKGRIGRKQQRHMPVCVQMDPVLSFENWNHDGIGRNDACTMILFANLYGPQIVGPNGASLVRIGFVKFNVGIEVLINRIDKTAMG